VTARAARSSGHGRDAIDQGEGLGDVVDVGRGTEDLERGAASVADQVMFAARLPPFDRRRTVSAPPFSRGCGSRPRTLWTSRVRWPRSARRAGCGAVGRRPQPAGTAPGAANRSVRSRTPAPAAGFAGLCCCAGRTGCGAATAGPPPAVGTATSPARATAAARSAPTSRRPRSMAGCSHPPERRNRQIGHAGPEHFNKTKLRARRTRSDTATVFSGTGCQSVRRPGHGWESW
jgi:hypothetical protein